MLAIINRKLKKKIDSTYPKVGDLKKNWEILKYNLMIIKD